MKLNSDSFIQHLKDLLAAEEEQDSSQQPSQESNDDSSDQSDDSGDDDFQLDDDYDDESESMYNDAFKALSSSRDKDSEEEKVSVNAADIRKIMSVAKENQDIIDTFFDALSGLSAEKMLKTLKSYIDTLKFMSKDPNFTKRGSLPKLNKMQRLSDVKYVLPKEFARPDLGERLYKKKARIRKKYTHVRNIMLFVDSSMSMSDTYGKVTMVKSFMATLLIKHTMEQLNSKDKLFIKFFSNTDSFEIIEVTESNKKQIMSEILKGIEDGVYFDGLGTSIERDMENASDFMMKNSLRECLIINDGQDSLYTINQYPFIVNAISLEVYNDELEELCLKNKGTYKSIL